MIDYLAAILNAKREGQVIALASVVGASSDHSELVGNKLLVYLDGRVLGSLGSPEFDARVANDCRQALGEGVATQLKEYQPLVETGEDLSSKSCAKFQVFIETLLPPPTLVIVGAGHIAQPLCRIGAMLGFAVAVLDDRLGFANRQRFPEAQYVNAGPFTDELAKFPLNRSTYVILVTRGHAHDEEALRQVIASDAAYIGMIGSRRRVAIVLRRMAEEGISDEFIRRIYTPIGLDIGAETPEEIAVAIIAEVIHARHRGAPNLSSFCHKKEGD